MPHRSRIIVGVTSTPIRINNIDKTLLSILKQTVPPDEVVLTIPKKSVRFGCEYNITNNVVLNLIKNKRVILNIIDDDYGPATKFVGLLYRNYNPSDVFIWIDDDIEYSQYVVQCLTEELSVNNVVGFSGFTIYDDGSIKKGTTHKEEVKIIEGFAGVACCKLNMPQLSMLDNYGIRPQHSDFFDNLSRIDKAEFLSDDLMISKYFEKNNIKMIIYCKPHCFFKNCINVLENGLSDDAIHKQPGGNFEKYMMIIDYYKWLYK